MAGMIGLFFMFFMDVMLFGIADITACSVGSSNAVKKHSGGSSDAVDPDLTLRRAASRTVSAMPEWLKKQANHLTPDRWKYGQARQGVSHGDRGCRQPTGMGSERLVLYLVRPVQTDRG